jgi:prephenate decarboxylase
MNFLTNHKPLEQDLVLKQTLRIGTLGPIGTSSEHAAKSFAGQHFQKTGLDCVICLHDTFEYCIEQLEKKELDYVIVPHAYEHINKFYMMPNLNLMDIFRCDTPLYGLAVRKNFLYHESMLSDRTIVSHPAPISLVKYFLNKDVDFSLVNSTSIAAQLVENNTYDLAITNDVARAKSDLDFVLKFKSIPMSWSLFEREEN